MELRNWRHLDPVTGLIYCVHAHLPWRTFFIEVTDTATGKGYEYEIQPRQLLAKVSEWKHKLSKGLLIRQ